ncbi:hypothetical protein NQZ68_040900 [Dissostichus eleginoides]|nr:hypothetical protein NQZ68_040900 [Dissostichus eleginoides]
MWSIVAQCLSRVDKSKQWPEQYKETCEQGARRLLSASQVQLVSPPMESLQKNTGVSPPS